MVHRVAKSQTQLKPLACTNTCLVFTWRLWLDVESDTLVPCLIPSSGHLSLKPLLLPPFHLCTGSNGHHAGLFCLSHQSLCCGVLLSDAKASLLELRHVITKAAQSLCTVTWKCGEVNVCWGKFQEF